MKNLTDKSTKGSLTTVIMCLFAMVVVAGCASTKVTSSEPVVTGQLPRPANIWVYDFAATAADLPAESSLAGEYSQSSARTKLPSRSRPAGSWALGNCGGAG